MSIFEHAKAFDERIEFLTNPLNLHISPTSFEDLYLVPDHTPPVEDNRDQIMVITGPSGSGKDSVKQALIKCDDQYVEITTATTRQRRTESGEPIEAYVWMTGWKPEYAEDKGAVAGYVEEYSLIEHDVHHGNLYGIPRTNIEEANGVPIVDLDVHGVINIFRTLGGLYLINSVLVIPPDFETLMSRFNERDNADARIDAAVECIEKAPSLVDMIFLNRTVPNFEDHLARTAQGIIETLNDQNEEPSI